MSWLGILHQASSLFNLMLFRSFCLQINFLCYFVKIEQQAMLIFFSGLQLVKDVQGKSLTDFLIQNGHFDATIRGHVSEDNYHFFILVYDVHSQRYLIIDFSGIVTSKFVSFVCCFAVLI